MSMDNADISGEHASSERHGSFESQENPNAMLNLFTQINLVDDPSKLAKSAATVKPEYVCILRILI
jgi:hypothetical protein